MEHRLLGASGFQVPVLCLGTATFGGEGAFKGFGASDVAEATRLVNVCLDAGLTMFDSADAYSAGKSEEILGRAIRGRRDRVIISTKSAFRVGPGPNDVGSSRWHLIRAVEGSLRRLGTDYIDLYQLHAFDRTTPVEETLGTLDDLVRAGKIRYIGCSNFSGWHLMKSLAVSKEYGLARYVAHQAYYSLVGRDYEWELMPLALDHGVGCVAWSPLGFARLTGKIRRGRPLPETSRLRHADATAGGPSVPDEYLFRVVDALDVVAAETGKTVPQVAINWVLRRPSVASVDHRRPDRGAAPAEPGRGRLGSWLPSRSPGSTPPARRHPPIPPGTSGSMPSGIRRRCDAIPRPSTNKGVGRKHGVAEGPFDLRSHDLEFQPVGQHHVGVGMDAGDAIENRSDPFELLERGGGATLPPMDHGRDEIVERLPAAGPSERPR